MENRLPTSPARPSKDGSVGPAPGARTTGEGRDELVVLADETFHLSGDVHGLVTFLNRSLKDDDYIFGLRLAEKDRYRLTIYRT